MNNIQFRAIKLDYATVIEFELAAGVITPEELGGAVEAMPAFDPRKGVILSGRGPIWLYVALAHAAHGAAWVATYEPRLGGAVVCMVHYRDRKIGDVIPITLPYQR